MITCVAQQSTTKLPVISNQRKHSPYVTNNDPDMSSVSRRKRLLSEQSDSYTSSMTYIQDVKKTKKGSFDYESKDKFHHHRGENSAVVFFESMRSSPGLLRRKSLTHSPFTYINEVVSSTHTTSLFLPYLSKTTTSLENNMLVCQQNSAIGNLNDNPKNDHQSILLTCPELAAYMTHENLYRTILIIDCGSPLRHTERRIRDSFLLNVNDKISRKRLATRGLKNFLAENQLNRLNKSTTIILYDDSMRPGRCADTSDQTQLSQSIKCIYDEIKKYDTNKAISVLQSPFEEFYQYYSSLCYISTSTDEDFPLVEPDTAQEIDIDLYEISEVLPGLFLGNSRDAENLNVLQQHKIKTVFNISETIPCFFQGKEPIEYVRVPCHDTATQDIHQHFETTFENIHQKLSDSEKILVHCQGGVSRSPSFIIGYLMKYHSKTFNEAFEHVKTKRIIVNPNLNFIGQLIQYQQTLISVM